MSTLNTKEVSAIGLGAGKRRMWCRVKSYTSSESLAAVQGRDLAGTDHEGAR